MTRTKPSPTYSIIRNVTFPFFNTAHYASFLGIVLLSAGFGFAMRDWVAFAFTFVIGYALFAASMWRYVPYVVVVPEHAIPRLVAELDAVRFLKREDDRLSWRRRGFLATDVDSIKIERSHLSGRRHDVMAINKLVSNWEV